MVEISPPPPTILEQPFPLTLYCGGIDSSAVDKSVMLTLLFSKIIYCTAAAFTSGFDVMGPLMDVHSTIFYLSTIF